MQFDIWYLTSTIVRNTHRPDNAETDCLQTQAEEGASWQLRTAQSVYCNALIFVLAMTLQARSYEDLFSVSVLCCC